MKKQVKNKSRRDFLKATAIGAAGMTMSGGVGRILAGTNWPQKDTIVAKMVNPTRVICCYDPSMITGTPANSNFTTLNNIINSKQVSANMDGMAKQLTDQTSADAAWRAIFRSGKAWGSTKVLIKVNTINPSIMPRIAVVDKICRVLTGFGVPAGNIFIYDANTNVTNVVDTAYTPYVGATGGLPAGINVVRGYGSTIGGFVNVTLPTTGSHACVGNLVNNPFDILVNCAVNKGHTFTSLVTLTMKNHYGTFAAVHGNNQFTYLLELNKSDPILGGTPIRQQLCIIDSFWGSNGGPNDVPNPTAYSRLIMGTLSPLVDYAMVKYIRDPIMGATNDWTNVNQFLSAFDYTATDLHWIEMGKVGTNEALERMPAVSDHIAFSMQAAPYRRVTLQMPVYDRQSVIGFEILNSKGGLVRTISAGRSGGTMWDGRTAVGGLVAPGNYIIRMLTTQGAVVRSMVLTAV